MNAFQYLRVNGRIFEQAKLYDLGKINVFCGKNNSGKSTVLNALSDRSNIQSGIMIDNSLIQEILELVSDHLNTLPNGSSAIERLQGIFQGKIFPFEIDFPELGSV